MKTQLFKSIGLLLVLITTSTAAFSQVYKFQSTGMGYMYYGEYGWTDWSAFEKTSVTIAFDFDRERITLNSKSPRTYRAYRTEKSTDEYGNEYLTYYCFDNDGLECKVALVLSQYDTNHIYVEYVDVKFLYNVYSLK